MSDLSDILSQAGGEVAPEKPEERLQVAPPEEEEGGLPEGPGFMALYTTLMLLLMTFFIVLVTMSRPSEGDFQQVKKSMQATFKLMGLSGSKQALLFIYSVLKIQNSTMRDAIDLHGPSATGNQVVNKGTEDTNKIYWEDGLSRDESEQLHRFIALGFNISSADTTEKYLKVKCPPGKVFKSGTIEFDDLFLATFKNFLSLIGTGYSKLQINVYTIEEPATADMGITSSLELSALRSQALADMIVDIQDVPSDRIEAIGYGRYFVGVDEEKIPKDKRELIEFKIYDLWGSTVGNQSNENKTESENAT